MHGLIFASMVRYTRDAFPDVAAEILEGRPPYEADAEYEDAEFAGLVERACLLTGWTRRGS